MDDAPQWRFNKALAGGGALPDVGLYCLNGARFLTGEEPVEVFARTYSTPGDPRFAEVEETVSFTLRFPSGTSPTAPPATACTRPGGCGVHAPGGCDPPRQRLRLRRPRACRWRTATARPSRSTPGA